MKTILLTVLLLTIWFLNPIQAQVEVQTNVVKTAQLQEDFKILKQALMELHPALYRYSTKAAIEIAFDELENTFSKDLTTQQVFIELSKFTAKIKCGHTYTNFWNQTNEVKELIHNKADKLPFTFDLINNRMFVTRNASEIKNLEKGIEVTSINGHSIETIIETLLPIMRGDGSNDAQRIYDLQLSAVGKYEAFDIYFALFFPPTKEGYDLTFENLKTGKTFNTIVKTVSRKERYEILKQDYTDFSTKPADLWQFEIINENVAKIYIGSFVTWEMDFDWKGFLKERFRIIKAKNIKNVILDIRGNGGGADEVYIHLAKYLVQKKVKFEMPPSLSKYTIVSKNLRPYLTTWDNKYFDISKKVKSFGDGFYEHKKLNIPMYLPKRRTAYNGQVYFLCNAANSSATYLLTKYIKQYNWATIVGQTTGGNQRGITGGRLFFMTLPNSKIEIDIPLISAPIDYNIPDAGIEPDIVVERSVEDMINGIDTEVEAVLKMINSNKKTN
jgi:C-terminal processing protease CtpA/Prc